MLIWLVCLDEPLTPQKDFLPQPGQQEEWFREKGLLNAWRSFFRTLGQYVLSHRGNRELPEHRLFFYHFKPISSEKMSRFIETYQLEQYFFDIAPVIDLIGENRAVFCQEIKRQLYLRYQIQTFPSYYDISPGSSSSSSPQPGSSPASGRRSSSIGLSPRLPLSRPGSGHSSRSSLASSRPSSANRRSSMVSVDSMTGQPAGRASPRGISPLATVTLLASAGRRLDSMSLESPLLKHRVQFTKTPLDIVDLPDTHDYFVIDSNQEMSDLFLDKFKRERHCHWETVNPRRQYLTLLLQQLTDSLQAMQPAPRGRKR